MGAGEYGHAVSIMGAEVEVAGGSANGTGTSSSSRRRHTHILNRFVTDQHIPRPESWYEDVHVSWRHLVTPVSDGTYASKCSGRKHHLAPALWLASRSAVQTAASQGHHKDDPMAQILYSEIAAAAESGMDFTARYFQVSVATQCRVWLSLRSSSQCVNIVILVYHALSLRCRTVKT